MNLQLGLSASQKAFRKGVLGGSDANIILNGSPEDIHRLWQEKRGEREPENLDDILQVRMGQWTEEFNRIWFTEKTGREITAVGEERLSLDYPFMACTLDGLTDDETTLWEAKHVGAFWKEEDVIQKYQPQIHHNAFVCGLGRGCLSVFFGNQKWVPWDIELNADYLAQLIAAEKAFWNCVETGKPPVDLPNADTPKQKAAARSVTIDLTGNEDWSALASEWMELRPIAQRLSQVEDSIKGFIDLDVVEASGHGLTVKIDRANRYHISETPKPKAPKKHGKR